MKILHRCALSNVGFDPQLAGIQQEASINLARSGSLCVGMEENQTGPAGGQQEDGQVERAARVRRTAKSQ